MQVYDAANIDEALKCSFCHERFPGVVKLIPDCCSSICGECYRRLRSETAVYKTYRCSACSEYHTMPDSELPDNRPLMAILQSRRYTKPVSEKALALKSSIEELQARMKQLESFDTRERIDVHCNLLEIAIEEAAGRAINYLTEIKEEMLRDVNAYRLGLLSPSNVDEDQLSRKADRIESLKREKQRLDQAIDGLGSKWSGYFSRADAIASEVEIEAGQANAKDYARQIKSLEDRIMNEFLYDNLMYFQPNEWFFQRECLFGELVKSKPSNVVKGAVISETPLCILSGHADWVNDVLFLANGNLASCGADKTIKIWNVEEGKEMLELTGHTGSVLSLALLSDGLLASGSHDGTIRVWNLNSSLVRTLEGHSRAVLLVKALGTDRLVSYSKDETIKIWNPCLSGSNLILSIDGHRSKELNPPLGVLSNGHLVVYSRHDQSDRFYDDVWMLRVLDSTDGKLLKSVSTRPRHAETLLVLANDQVAVGFEDGSIKIVDLKDEPKSRVLENAHGDVVSCMVQLPDGSLVSAARDKTIKVWNLRVGNLIQSISADVPNWFISLSISPDGRLLASANGDRAIRLWSLNF